jgi:glycosyltransferase involved in cell wall biosynthesis
VCFYSELVYPMLGTSRLEFAGGAEALVALLARGLAARGYEVSIVTCDFGQPARERVDGVTVLRTFVPRKGIPVLRFFHPRLTRAIRALLEADADVYCVYGSGMQAGLTYDVARLKRRRFVMVAASDYEVVRHTPRHAGARGWYFRALRGASAMLAQTEYQQRCLREEFGVHAGLLPNIVEIPEQVVDPGQDGIVMWLATYKVEKRPEWFTALARALPRYRFVMAGVVPPPPLTRAVWDACVAAAAQCPNLEVRGFQPVAELKQLMRRASLIVHTSPVEGFSNVMLEAWAAGLPTVSGVDPDDTVKRRGVGAHVTEFPALVEAVQKLMEDPAARRAAGARARAYAIERHSPQVVLDILCGVLDRQIEAVRGAGRGVSAR